MRLIVITLLALLIYAAPECSAQRYELGGIGGFGIQKGLTAKTSNAGADTGFKTDAAFGVVLGGDMYDRLSGEIRYLYRLGDSRVASGGQETTFTSRAHIVHYDFVYHFSSRESKIRPFVAVGSGVKIFQGTGTEQAFQPLSQFILLTKKTETQPLISLGGGVKWNIKSHLRVRIELRDYLTPPPKKVLTPAPGASISGWLHDILPMAGLSYTF